MTRKREDVLFAAAVISCAVAVFGFVALEAAGLALAVAGGHDHAAAKLALGGGCGGPMLFAVSMALVEASQLRASPPKESP